MALYTHPPVMEKLSPAGIVPVNRAQPMATDGQEFRRLAEQRVSQMGPPIIDSGQIVPLNPNPVRIGPYNPAMPVNTTLGGAISQRNSQIGQSRAQRIAEILANRPQRRGLLAAAQNPKMFGGY